MTVEIPHSVLINKIALLVIFSILLYVSFVVTGSYAVLSDSFLSIVDALYLFLLWLSIFVAESGISIRYVRLMNAGVLLISVFLISGIVLLLSYLFALGDYTVVYPEVGILVEFIGAGLLLYLYASLKEYGAEKHVHVVDKITKEIEINMIVSLSVIISLLFSGSGIYTVDKLVALIVSVYASYRTIELLLSSLRSIVSQRSVLEEDIALHMLGFSEEDVIMDSIEVGPYTIIEIMIRGEEGNEELIMEGNKVIRIRYLK